MLACSRSVRDGGAGETQTLSHLLELLPFLLPELAPGALLLLDGKLRERDAARRLDRGDQVARRGDAGRVAAVGAALARAVGVVVRGEHARKVERGDAAAILRPHDQVHVRARGDQRARRAGVQAVDTPVGAARGGDGPEGASEQQSQRQQQVCGRSNKTSCGILTPSHR